MSGLYSSINSTVMALNAHSRSIEITGKNLANVNNPDYAQHLLVQSGTAMLAQANQTPKTALQLLQS